MYDGFSEYLLQDIKLSQKPEINTQTEQQLYYFTSEKITISYVKRPMYW